MWAHPQAKHPALEGQGTCQPPIPLQMQQPALVLLGISAQRTWQGAPCCSPREAQPGGCGKAQLPLPRALQRGKGAQVQLLPKGCERVRAGSDFTLGVAASRGLLSTQRGGGGLNIPAWQVSTAISVSHSA